MIHKSKLIINNKKDFVKEIHLAAKIYKEAFPEKDLTWGYNLYNTFGITSPSKLFYELFKELRTVILNYTDSKYIWMQSWINFHQQDEVLHWHSHEWDFHGYITIEPHQTRTVFENFEIVNEVGNIYIGPGDLYHKVIVDKEFNTPRITLGFNCHTKPLTQPNNTNRIFPKQIGLIPIIR